MSTKHNRIQVSSGVYICSECGKKTRDTGQGEAEVEMCAHCYNVALWINYVSDGGDINKVPEEYRAEVA
jgi:Zn-finger nucleic acid-binding protein